MTSDALRSPDAPQGADRRPRWCLVPARDFATAKLRLGASLDAAARAGLCRELFVRALTAATASEAVDRVLVLTDAPAVAAVARSFGADVLFDEANAPDDDALDGAVPVPRLAAAVARGLTHAAAAGAASALVVMADLPRLTAADLTALAEAGRSVALALAPDRERFGTNAIALELARLRRTAFGGGPSYQRHVALAEASGVSWREVVRDGLAWDLDEACDLETFLRG